MTETNSISRRKVLQILGLSTAGVATAGAVAACAPATPPGGSSSSSGGEFHGGWPYTAPPEGNYNALSPSALLSGSPYQDLVNMPSAYYLWADKTWVNFLVDSFKLDGDANTYTIKIKSGLTWSDGTALTSADYAATFWSRYILRGPMWSYVKDISTPDDTTVVLNLKSPSTVLERYVLKERILPAAQYKEWADQAEALVKAGKSMTDSAGAALSAAFLKFAPPTYLANGPFNIDTNSVTNTQLTMNKNDKGAMATDVKFAKVVIYNGETDSITPLVQSKDVDYATHGFPPSSETAFSSEGFRILRAPNYSGAALLFNMNKLPEFQDARARQAIAQIIDRDVNGTVSLGDSGKGVKYMAGFSDNQLDDWLSADEKGKLATYPHDNDAATQLLVAAGWKQNGSSWNKPDGTEAKYEVAFAAQYADYSATGKNVAQQLSDFGIATTPRGVDQAQAPIDVDKGNFQLAIQGWGSSLQPHPTFAFTTDVMTHNKPISQNNGGNGIDFDLTSVKTSAFGTVDLGQLITDSGKGLDAESQKATVAKVAAIFNELLPIVPLYERYGNNPALEGVRVKAFPSDDDPILQNPAYADNFVILWLLQGKLLPV